MPRLKESIRTMGPYKAAGPDGIQNKVLQQLDETCLRRLLYIYRAMLHIGYTPKVWRSSRVVYIPKEGKSDYTQVRSFRPISLMKTFFKVFERLILWRVLETSLKDQPMSESQHGF